MIIKFKKTLLWTFAISLATSSFVFVGSFENPLVNTAYAATTQTKTIEGCSVTLSLIDSTGKQVASGTALDRKKEYKYRLSVGNDCSSGNGFDAGYVTTSTSAGKTVYTKTTDSCYGEPDFIQEQKKQPVEAVVNDGGGKDLEVYRFVRVTSTTTTTENQCKVGYSTTADYAKSAVFVQAKWAGAQTSQETPEEDCKKTNTCYVKPTAGNPFNAIEGGLKIDNPTGQENLLGVVAKAINWLLAVLAMIATIMVLYAGVLYLVSRGDQSAVSKAKSTLTWAIIGLVVSIGAFALVSIIINLL